MNSLFQEVFFEDFAGWITVTEFPAAAIMASTKNPAQVTTNLPIIPTPTIKILASGCLLHCLSGWSKLGKQLDLLAMCRGFN